METMLTPYTVAPTLRSAFVEGVHAHIDKDQLTDNPYQTAYFASHSDADMHNCIAWTHGWQFAERSAKKLSHSYESFQLLLDENGEESRTTFEYEHLAFLAYAEALDREVFSAMLLGVQGDEYTVLARYEERDNYRRTADHIDGYDRDDLGESPDF